MYYNTFKDKQLSALGLGCMRFPTLADGTIDIEKTTAIVDYAIKNGINYFDTAWVYHNEQSETVVGDILSGYPRESFYLATKFPGFDVKYLTNVKEIFEAQLKKCKTLYTCIHSIHSTITGVRPKYDAVILLHITL